MNVLHLYTQENKMNKFFYLVVCYAGQWAEREKSFRMTADGSDLVGGKYLIYFEMPIFNKRKKSLSYT